jgi:glutamate-1-semialdehyde aminotransferase
MVLLDDCRGKLDELGSGYAQTKWVAEDLVLQAMELGLSAAIYRIGLVVGRLDNAVHRNLNDVGCRFIKCCIQLGKFPRGLDSRGVALPVIPVDLAVQFVHWSSMHPSEACGKSINLVHPHAFDMATVRGSLTRHGFVMEDCPLSEWYEALQDADSENAMLEYIPAIDEQVNDWLVGPEDIANWLQEKTLVQWKCDNMVQILNKMGVTCRSIDYMLPRYIDYFVSIGFLPAPTGAGVVPKKKSVVRMAAEMMCNITPRLRTMHTLAVMGAIHFQNCPMPPDGQIQIVAELADLYTKHTSMSKQVIQQYRSVHADGRYLWPRHRTGGVVHTDLDKQMCYPLSIAHAKDQYVWDVDGNKMVDLLMGYGACFYGHSPAFIAEPVVQRVLKGFAVGTDFELAGKVAALICKLTGVERICYTNSGTEAVLCAMRLARSYTLRKKIVSCNGHYHGWADVTQYCGAPGMPCSPLTRGVVPTDTVQVVDFGSDEVFELLAKSADEIAAVIVEPVTGGSCVVNAGFLHKLRDACSLAGVILIFDEVYQGFRCHVGGAQAYFGIKADLVTYGKIPGGGYPFGAVGGSHPAMDHVDGGVYDFDGNSMPNQAATTFVAGTFCKHPIMLTAADAILSRFVKRGNRDHEQLNRNVDRLCDMANRFFDSNEFPVQLVWFATSATVVNKRSIMDGFSVNDPNCYAAEFFAQYMHLKGVYVPDHLRLIFSAAHTDADYGHVLSALTSAARELFTPLRRLTVGIGDLAGCTWSQAELQIEDSDSINNGALPEGHPTTPLAQLTAVTLQEDDPNVTFEQALQMDFDTTQQGPSSPDVARVNETVDEEGAIVRAAAMSLRSPYSYK